MGVAQNGHRSRLARMQAGRRRQCYVQ